MGLLRSILVACFMIPNLVFAVSFNKNPSERAKLALTLFSTVPKNYAAAWGEVYRCNYHRDQTFELHGLSTAFSVSGDVACTVDPEEPMATTCDIPVQVKWLRMRAIINTTEGEAFFKTFTTTLSMKSGTIMEKDLGEYLRLDERSETGFDESQRTQMIKCARTGLEHLMACLRWAECRPRVTPVV